MKIQSALFVFLLFLNILISDVYCKVTHRYDFVSSADDVVGGLNSTLMGNALVDNGQLVLDGVDDWLEMDASSIAIISYTTGLTLELWSTQNTTNQNYSMTAAFGDTYANGLGKDYLAISTTRGSEVSRAMIANTLSDSAPWQYEIGVDGPELNDNLEHHYVLTIDDSNANGSGRLSYYIDGQLQGTAPLNGTIISDVSNTYAYLGKSVYPNDAEFRGTINEFRIHDLALSASQVQASFSVGPDILTDYIRPPENPDPIDRADNVSPRVTLRWQSDDHGQLFAHRLYLGTDQVEVADATVNTVGIYKGELSSETERYGPVDLEMGRSYYWRIDEVDNNGIEYRGDIWSFRTANLLAHSPEPKNNSIVHGLSTELRWTSGYNAVGHDIYWGINVDDMELLENNWSINSYQAIDLEFGMEYFWRIDERFSDGQIRTGIVWSFKTTDKPPACIAGDFNGDCVVNIFDLFIMADHWLIDESCYGYDCTDLDGNEIVGINDYAIFAANWLEESAPKVVINEIHYHPDHNKEPVEFIELFNAGVQAIDLNGWHLDSAVRYTFQDSVMMNPGDYLVVSKDPIAFQAKYGITALGPFDGKLSNEGERVVLRKANGEKIDQVEYDSEFPWPIAANGEGASMELINPYLDNDLAGSWRSSGYHYESRPEFAYGSPSPGLPNVVFSDDIPPQIRQVKYTPQTPLSSDNITITSKITDPQGVSDVTLKYQLVSPGAYIPAYLPISISSLINNPYQDQPINPDFEDEFNWSRITMRDDGVGADLVAGDSVYTAVIEAQDNRTLVRYRIEAQDISANSIEVPYADDPSFNFAVYVYDGVPDYVASDHSVSADGPGHVYSSKVLTSIPVYTLITRADDLYECNGYDPADRIDQGTTVVNVQDAGRAYNWEGAFIYEGKVYDHIVYRLRGGNGRYNNGAAGKRSMKFRFNRGNYFKARDLYGKKFPSKWQHLNTGKMFGNKIVWDNYRQYPYGINEVANMKLFDMVDVPSPHTWWIHFRVVDGFEEAPQASGGQYDGDLWGLYVAFENYDGAFLKRLGLPKGNLYKLSDKIYDGPRQLRYQGDNAVDDASDYENIRWNLTHEASAEFIRNHLDCDQWFRYHTVTEAIRHYDVFSGDSCIHCLKNAAWYFYPEYTAENNYLGKLQFLPFDVDDTWGPFWNQGCDHAKAAIFDQRFLNTLEQFPEQSGKRSIKQEYRNYIREFRDLVWQPEVIDNMIDELAAIIEDIVPADRDRWRFDPTVGGAIDNGELENGIALMHQFAWSPGGRYYWVGSSNHLDNLAGEEGDAASIPHTPVISYTGTDGYPLNDLRFQTSDFSDPQGGSTFAAMKWRIAQHAISIPGGSEPATSITLLDQNQTWHYQKGTEEPSTPTDLWRQNGFNDEEWFTGRTVIGYGDGDDLTTLNDMRDNYSTLYFRNTFEVLDKDNIKSLKLHVYIDDGCIIWINGIEVARLYCSNGEKAYNSFTDVPNHEAVYYEEVIFPTPYDYLINGDNVIAVHGLQETLGSSDFSFDMKITADLLDEQPFGPVVEKSKYEIDSIWESDELTTFANEIRIPAKGITQGKNYRVRCKMKDTTGRWSHWSEPVEFVTGEPVGADILNYLRITELMYNNGDADFIELKNTSNFKMLNLSGVSFTDGIEFDFGDPAISSISRLMPGDFVLVVRNQAAFEEQYGTSLNNKIAGVFEGKLSNSGEIIRLEDYWNGILVEFEYGTGRGWPIAADGSGHSLVPLSGAIEDQPFGTLDYGANWRHSTYMGASPGQDDPTPVDSVVINEIMAHTDYFVAPHESNDWIELYNAGSVSVALDNNWFLSDDIDDLDKYALPSSVLLSGGYVSYDQITHFNPDGTGPQGWGLNKNGDELFLSYLPGVTGQDRIVDCVKFKGQQNNVSLSRYPDRDNHWFATSPATRESANANVVENIVISEIMYHPTEGTINDEYIELYNPTNSPIDMWTSAGSWTLDGGVDYQFPPSISLAPGKRIIIVGFDPVLETSRLEAFEVAYNTDNLIAGVDIFGPWSGNLSNNGERVAVEKPQESDDPMDTTSISWIIVDECIYNDYWPWPIEADGSGDALFRMNSLGSGDDPENWYAQTPSPGS